MELQTAVRICTNIFVEIVTDLHVIVKMHLMGHVGLLEAVEKGCK